MSLIWPGEAVTAPVAVQPWCQASSNVVLDFHGDPVNAQLVVYSDGNHHMALLGALEAFYRRYPEVRDIFYATTPPRPILSIVRDGAIRLGNLTLSVQPHVFISPPRVMDRLVHEGLSPSHHLLARNQGSVLLITRDNASQIASVSDLMRRDVRLFISNPNTEAVSYQGYRQTLEGLAKRQGLDIHLFCDAVFDETAVYGQVIHHREAPQALADGRADVAIVYYHLALRYTRIFPDRFDFIPLGGTREHPDPYAENQTAAIHVGLIGDGGRWGPTFLVFMQGRQAAEIYTAHGLRHRMGLKAARDG
jgi:hypothetical protein